MTSVPCHSSGEVRGRYIPRIDHHPFDTSYPQIGDKMFEDIVTELPKEPLKKIRLQNTHKVAGTLGGSNSEDRSWSSEESSSAFQLTNSEMSSSQLSQELAACIADQGESLALSYSVPRTRARIAATRRIVLSSSPRNSTATPQSTRKRKRPVTDEPEHSAVEYIAPPPATRRRTAPPTKRGVQKRA